MTPLIPSQTTGISLFRPGSIEILAQADTTTTTTNTSFGSFIQNITASLPAIVGALLVLGVGLLLAWIASLIVKGLLRKTSIDDRIAASITGRPASDMHVAKWVSTAVFWIIAVLALAGFLEALNLTAVSRPINDAIATVLLYIPRIFSAAILIAVAWAIATLVKSLVTKGLESLHLDDRLAENTGVDPRENSVQIHETLGNAAYWFVFLLFLPLILNSLELDGLLEPVNGLINQFLAAIPQILKAALIFAGGWLIAKIVKGIVTSLLAATGIDAIGHRVGLSRSLSGPGMSLSGLLGTTAYALILLTAGISALEALNIAAISRPAVSMLQQILNFIPLLIAAGLVLALFYFIGQFVKDLVSNLLSSVGFDGILESLGLPDIGGGSTPTTSRSSTTPPPGTTISTTTIQPTSGETTLQSSTSGTYSTGTSSAPYDPNATSTSSSASGMDPSNATASPQSPSEIAGVVALVGVMLFGVVTATEILQLTQLTLIVRAVIEIAGQVLVAMLILAIGLYIANLAYRLIQSSGASSSKLLAQIARAAILFLVGAMALGQVNIAPGIVNLAFGLLLGAVAVAIAISFGLGGREVANEQLKKWVNKAK